MTASKKVAEGMANTRESAILSAAAEAVTWRHATEPVDGPRKGQRIVIHPKDLPQLEQVLSTGDPSIDSEDGHPVAYAAILQAAQSFENPPRFLREDSEEIISNPIWSEKTPECMNLASQVATGNRRRVLEDGPDKIVSEDEDIEDMKPDEEKNMYTPDMDPSKGPVRLSQAQVAAQKAAAQAQKELRVPQRSQSPVTGSSDDDDPDGPEYKWSSSKGIFRKNKNWKGSKVLSQLALTPPPPQKALTAPEPQKALAAPELQKALPAHSKGGNVTQEKLIPPAQPVNAPKPKKAAASQKAPAGQKPGPETKASKPVTGQESSETKVSKPMETRRQASRAGSLRSGGGLGLTDTCVVPYNPSKT
jgi:hypothetical protein